jgi:oligoendopeptidase F
MDINQGNSIGRWDLSELLPSEDENVISERLNRLHDLVRSFEKHRAELHDSVSPEELLNILIEYEHLVEEMQVLSAYGTLRFAADTLSPDALTLRNRIEHELTALGNRTLFFSLWWKNLVDASAESLLPDGKEHADYRHFLKDLRRYAPYTLDEKSEQIINLKDADGINALLTLYSMLTSRLVFALEVDGKEEQLTRDELVKYVRSPKEDIRKAAYQELYRVYMEEAPVLAQIYANRVRDWHSENIEVRGFESPIDVRNLANDVAGESVDIILDVTRKNAQLFRRYFELKADWLGLEKLRRYDIYATLPSWRTGSSARTILTVKSGRGSRAVRSAQQCFLQCLRGCCSTLPVKCGMLQRWLTNWVTLYTACWPQTTPFSHSIHLSRLQRQLLFSGRCWLPIVCWSPKVILWSGGNCL